MPLISDPAKWIVVALLTCIHLTCRIWKKSTTPFEWRNLLPGLAVIGLAGCCCLNTPISQSPMALAPWVAIICGFVISGRQNSVSSQFGATLLGMFVAIWFLGATFIFTHFSRYTDGQPTWCESYYESTTEGLPSLDRDNKTRHFAPGYVDANNFGSANAVYPGPFHVTTPAPLWHTCLTGVYGRKTKVYRLWLPGGTAEQTLNGALAVPLGTPAGQESKQGLPVDSYFSEERILSEE